MKTFVTVAIVLFISLNFNCTHAQTKLKQIELYKQFVGTWNANIGADSLEVRECREYGLSFVIDVYRIIKGEKIPLYINNVSFDANDGKFKGFLLYPNGGYFTWVGSFTEIKFFSGKIVFNFMPEVAWSEFHAHFINQDEFTCTNFNQEGEQTIEMKFVKIQ